MYDIDTSIRLALEVVAGGAPLEDVLRGLAGTVVERLGAGSCKIWLVKQGDMCVTCALATSCNDRTNCLHLKASAPGIGVELPRVPLVVFRDRVAARGGSGRVGDGVGAGRLLFGADEIELASGDAYTLVPLRGPSGVVGLLATLGDAPIDGTELEALRGLADVAVVAIRLADLTSRHLRLSMRVEASSRERDTSRELLDAILAGCDGFSILAEDLDGRVTHYGEGARRLFGYAPERMVGAESADLLFAPEEVLSGRVGRIFEEAMRDGRCDALVHRVRESGERFQSRATFIVRRDSDGDPAGMIVVERDLSVDREAQRLRAENAELGKRLESTRELERRIGELEAELEEARREIAEASPAEPFLDFVTDASEALVFAAAPEIVSLARERLEAAGRNVRVVASVADAAAIAEEVRPGVAAVDLAAPGAASVFDGLSHAQYNPRIVALGAEIERGAALARGASVFVCRPVEPLALDDALARATGRPARVLAVVDDPEARQETRVLVDHPAFDVEFEASWAAARARLVAERFDALLVDLRMPGACGFALLDHTRFGSGVPVVVASASAETAARARDLGAAVLDDANRGRDELLAALDRAVTQIDARG